MKAWVQKSYGPPSELEEAELPKPEPKRGQVLVRVRAVGLNGSDLEIKTGRPGYARLHGLFRPRVKVLGSDIAGTVEAVGAGVSGFSKGDPVFGDFMGDFGGLAEFAALPAAKLLRIPRGLDFTSAAAVPQSLILAHQLMTRPGPLPKGARLLVNGAGGGVGTFVLQIARTAGHVVSAVDRGTKLDALKKFGVYETFDFEIADFTDYGPPWDRIVDVWATRSPYALAGALTDGGHYWAVGGETRTLLKIALTARLTRAARGRKIKVLAADESRAALQAALPLVERGVVSPVIDRIYPLDQAAQALARVGAGDCVGKVVVRVG